MRWNLGVGVVYVIWTSQCIGQIVPLTQKDACAKFSDPVVSIDAGGQSLGSGFIVSADGFILTANHVVRNEESGQYFSAIFVTLPNGKVVPANPAVPLSAENIGEDFALLKVDGQTHLPFLKLGSAEEVVTGGDATIIGFPFSALDKEGGHMDGKFCLSALVAAADVEPVQVYGTETVAKVARPFHRTVQVDVVYFQGPSVKGISGSPIISRDTGNVIGIVSTKLTGLGTALTKLETQTAQGLGGKVGISGINFGPTLNAILTTLDQQLANGLGSAVGIEDPKEALTRIQRKKR